MSGLAPHDDSPTPPSSGAPTPPTSDPSGSSYLSNMWTGLIRRLTTDDAGFAPPDHHHQQSFDPSKDGVHDVFVPARRLASPFRPPPLDPLILHGYRESTPASGRLLSHAVAEEVRNMIPERLRITEDWRLVYSLEQDGASLSTLYQRCKDFETRRVGFVIVVKDRDGGVFGAYLSEYPHPAPSYFGNGECFLWRASTLASLPPPPSADTTNMVRETTLGAATRRPPSSGFGSRINSPAPSLGESIRFKAFPYSGLNDCYINCETGFLSVGSGGGHYGLWLDDSLDVGHSSQCETFGNEPLSDEGEKFSVLGVEMWVVGS